MHTLPNLPYAYNALEPYIDEETMHVHHDKHHAAYVKNLNDALVNYPEFNTIPVEELLKKINKISEIVRIKVKNNAGGHANHSLFWESMAPNPTGILRKPQGDLSLVINSTFGSFEQFQEKFSILATNHFGSGWVWLSVKNKTVTIEETLNQDSPLSAGKTPLLTLDVWEHAYYLKYQNRRVEYINAWWNVVNWQEVEKRFSKVR